MAKAKTAKAAKIKGNKPVTRKRSTSKKAKLDDKNKKNTVKQVVKSQREIKYKYPADIDNQLDRKSWRQKVRGKDKGFMLRITKLEASAKKKEEIRYKRFRTEHYLVP